MAKIGKKTKSVKKKVAASVVKKSAKTKAIKPTKKTGATQKVSAAAGKRLNANSVGMEFISIPAGSFTMGSPKKEKGRGDDEKQVKVTITRAFELGKTVVTQQQWTEVMGTTESDENVTKLCDRDDATEFCKKLTALERKSGKLSAKQKYRLPTEAEWEYACRAGTKKPNPWGLDGMREDVLEWCSDWDSNNLDSTTDEDEIDRGSCITVSRIQVKRGGSYRDLCLSSTYYDPYNNEILMNIRVVRSAIKPAKKTGGTQKVSAAGKRLNANSVGMEFISTPAGSFTMGSPNTNPYHFEFNSPEAVEAYEMSERKRVKKMTNVNKSEESRKVAAELRAKGETVHPKTISDILEKRGIKVVPKEVSFVLKKVGCEPMPVTITRAFELGKTVVTQQQWIEVMGTTPWKDEAKDEDEGDNYPAVWISWDDVTKFCKKLTALERKSGKLSAKQKYRLPTEAEWEYACRAGTTTAFSCGDDESSLGDYAWYDKNSGSELYEVATKKPNPWGLFDMHGNVDEWCEDWYEGSLSGGNDPKGPSAGSYRVLRGGSWDDAASDCRSAVRHNYDPASRHYYGFRIVRVLL